MTTAAQIQSYKDLGCDGVEFLATLDEITCETCGPLDGIHFTFDDVKEGATVPPMHPNCRCCLSPWYTDDEPSGKRGARNPETGKWEDVPDMKYDDWKDIFVDKNKTLEEWLSVNSSLARGIGTDAYNAVFDGIAEKATDQNVVKLWKKHAHNVKVLKTNAKKSAFDPSRNGIQLDMKKAVSGDNVVLPYETIVHEIGHAIDWVLGGKGTNYSSTWKQGKFVKTLVAEVEQYVDKKSEIIKKLYEEENWEKLCEMGAVDKFEVDYFLARGVFPYNKKPKYSKRRTYESIAKELNTSYTSHDSACLKDMMEGATKGKISPNAGHGASYWQKSGEINGVNENLGSEAFAEFTEAVLFNEGSLNTIRLYLPRTYEQYLQMVQDAIQNE